MSFSLWAFSWLLCVVFVFVCEFLSVHVFDLLVLVCEFRSVFDLLQYE